MKVLVCLLLIVTRALCEVPPPYTTRGFRPSSQLSLPQRTYGVPSAQPPKQLSTKYGPPPPSDAEPLDPSFKDNSTPIKFSLNNEYRTIKDTFEPVRAPQRVYGVPKIVNSRPQNTFGAPQKQQLPQVQTQNIFAIPQTTYGVPSSSNPVAQPQKYYGTPDAPQKQQLPQVQTQNLFASSPQTVYGAPAASNPLTQNGPVALPQQYYGTPDEPQKQQQLPQVQSQNVFTSIPQTAFNPWTQSGFATLPQRNYGAPDASKATVDAATLEEIRELKQVLQRIEALRLAEQRTKQYVASQIAQQQNQQFNNRFVQNLPTQDSNNFRNSLSNQYLPVKEPENFKKFVAPTVQDSASTNFNFDNAPSFREDQGRVTPNRYIPPNQNNNQGEAPTNSWNGLDLPNVNDGNAESNNGFSNSVPSPNNVPNVDVQKVEVTQFGPRNRNRNNSAGPSTTIKPPINDFGTGSNEDRVNNRYIPPTIENPVLRGPLPTTPVPPPAEPDYLDQGQGAETPNIAVATSVAVPQNDQQFYLLQPDGTYQSIVLQERGRQGKTTPYGQNYVLQNLRTDSNIAYTPVVSLLGK